MRTLPRIACRLPALLRKNIPIYAHGPASATVRVPNRAFQSAIHTRLCHNDSGRRDRLLALLRNHCQLDSDVATALANHVELYFRLDNKDRNAIDALFSRIEKRVELLRKCGVEPGSDLQTLLTSTGYGFLYVDQPLVDVNLETLSRKFSHAEILLLLKKVPSLFLTSDMTNAWNLSGCRSELRRLAEQAKQDEMVKSLLRQVDEAGQLAPVDAPEGTMSFFHHQRQGLAWMLWREQQDVAGGILADDMGVGKTLTCLAVVLHDKLYPGGANENEVCDCDVKEDELDGSEPETIVSEASRIPSNSTLVVAPKTALPQWKDNVETHMLPGALSVHEFYGKGRKLSAKALVQHDIVTTTYQEVAAQMKAKGPLAQVRWKRIVLDEANKIKNAETAAHESCCALAGQHRWCVTGTPINNSLGDLYSLLK